MNPVALYKDTSKNSDAVSAQIDTMREQDLSSSSRLRYNSATAALPSALPVNRPAWMNQPVVMRGQNMPFSMVVNKVLEPVKASTTYQDGVRQDMSLSFNYKGTVGGALDKLATMTGYAYTVEGSTVSWLNFVTKTFDVSFMPGASQYLMGEKSGGSTLSSSGNSGGGSTMSGQTMTSQYSNLQGTLSVWADLEKTINTMLSKEGQVMVSQATTTITVRDHPENVRVIGEYLASMNKDLSREVSLQVQVLQLRLDKQFTYGINWNLVAGRIGISGGLSQPGTTSLGNDLVNLGGIAATGIGFVSGKNTALLEALQAQGKLSIVTQPRVMTLNNQVAQIAITTQKTYLASQTATVTGGTTGAVQSSLTPGVVSTGFTLYVLPKIINNNIYLQLTSEFSNLDNLTTISGGSLVQGGTSSTTPSSIQAPTVSSKSFNQRAMVPTGCTLVLSGFRQVTNETNKSSFFGFDPLGSRGAQQDDIETLVLITPTIVGNSG